MKNRWAVGSKSACMLLISTLLASAGCASDRGHDPSLKESARDAGKAIGTATREIGKGAKKAGKAIGEAAKEGGKAFKEAVKRE